MARPRKAASLSAEEALAGACPAQPVLAVREASWPRPCRPTAAGKGIAATSADISKLLSRPVPALSPLSFPACGLGRSDGVAGGFGGVLPSGWGGPPEGAVGELIDLPPGVLLEPMVMPTLRTAITQAAPATGLVRDVMFEITIASRPPADRAGTGSVPDLGQVPEPDPGIVALGLEPVIAVPGGDRVQRHQQISWSAGPGPEPPGAVSAGGPGRPVAVKANPGPSRILVPPGGAGPCRFPRLAAPGRAQP